LKKLCKNVDVGCFASLCFVCSMAAAADPVDKWQGLENLKVGNTAIVPFYSLSWQPVVAPLLLAVI